MDCIKHHLMMMNFWICLLDGFYFFFFLNKRFKIAPTFTSIHSNYMANEICSICCVVFFFKLYMQIIPNKYERKRRNHMQNCHQCLPIDVDGANVIMQMQIDYTRFVQFISSTGHIYTFLDESFLFILECVQCIAHKMANTTII